jgi:uncharacterized protein
VRYRLLLTVLLASTTIAAATFDETMAAAKQGDAYAQFNLALMFNSGIGVPENYAEAAKWYRKAADQGLDNAQFNLGLLYKFGNGVPENDAEAVKWFRKAADQGRADAPTNLDILKPKMTPQQIADAQALAAKCYESYYKECD